MPKKPRIINIGNSDEKADWIKRIDNGQAQERDLKAHEEAKRPHRSSKRQSP
jgi:hypothetical protein